MRCKQAQNSRIFDHVSFIFQHGPSCEGFCKRNNKNPPRPPPKGRGEITCGEIATVLWLSNPQRPLNHNKKSRFYMTNEQ